MNTSDEKRQPSEADKAKDTSDHVVWGGVQKRLEKMLFGGWLSMSAIFLSTSFHKWEGGRMGENLGVNSSKNGNHSKGEHLRPSNNGGIVISVTCD